MADNELAVRVRLFIRLAKQNWIYLLIGLAGGLMIFGGNAAKGGREIYLFFVPPQDALQVEAHDLTVRGFPSNVAPLGEVIPGATQ